MWWNTFTLTSVNVSAEHGSRMSGTHYASPPQMPSTLMSTTHSRTPNESAPTRPVADSTVRVSRIAACMMAGSEMKRPGSGGRPSEIDDREKNTEVW